MENGMKATCPHCGEEFEVKVSVVMADLGSRSSEAKKRAAKENGKKGGRPTVRVISTNIEKVHTFPNGAIAVRKKFTESGIVFQHDLVGTHEQKLEADDEFVKWREQQNLKTDKLK
jgi:hypothetical protein